MSKEMVALCDIARELVAAYRAGALHGELVRTRIWDELVGAVDAWELSLRSEKRDKITSALQGAENIPRLKTKKRKDEDGEAAG